MRGVFPPVTWNGATERECLHIIERAVAEDLGDPPHDWSSESIVPADAVGRGVVVARGPGIVAGLPAVPLVLKHFGADVQWQSEVSDGDRVGAGTCLGTMSGNARSILAAERIALNCVGHLSGIATLTGEYVRRIGHTSAQLFDTRKTTPGWRRLQKYAVRCGGGHNHRIGLCAAVMLKDNHLALAARADATGRRMSPAEAVSHARQALRDHPANVGAMVVQIELDQIADLDGVLRAEPDIVLLDNMSCDQLRQAVAGRDRINRQVILEASGGILLDTIAAVAETGIDRISVGALTHSAPCWDVGLDWLD